jgi:two-component system, LytTR family, response regulator
MKRYTCIIVDDEQLARELIASHISKIGYLDVVATCSNAIEAKQALEIHNPDVLFLDIHMPNLTGLQLLKMLKKQPATIITTAHAEFAIEGFELDVIDYLLKPIVFERFFKAVTKVVDWIERGQDKFQTSSSNNPVSVVDKTQDDYFFVKSDYKIIKIAYDDILFIEALQKYVQIYTNQQRIVTLLSMSQLVETLPQSQFIRVHRSYIINLDKIENIDGNMIKISKHNIPISKSQREDFLKEIQKKGKGW